MRTFRDNEGRTWTVDLTIGAANRVRTLLGVDLLALTDGEPRLIDRLTNDLALQIDVVFALIRPQVEAAGLTDEQWAASMGGEAAAKAIAVFWEELLDFFHPLRPAMEMLARAARQAVEARQQLAAAIGAAVLDRTTSADVPAVSEPNRGGSSGSLPASSGSIPGR